ncbi:N-acetylmuramoyl-L-alanine amidase family protein [Paenibacillus chitinolyticus]|uniref:peptidoglycan recognition protein family protein n=1 Tax=Paenibacillus chitinolyticus TaxID=79263 RepID=UPI0036DA9F1E
MSIPAEIISCGGYSIGNAFIAPSPWTRIKEKIKPMGGIIHWTGNIGKGANARANRNFFNNRSGSYGSAHLIGDSEEIVAALPYLPGEAEMAYHVGANTYYTRQFGAYPNRTTLGYEMCVHADGNFRESYKRAVWAMAHLCRLYGWNPRIDIRRHWDITHKDCPLPFMDLLFDDRHCAGKGWTSGEIAWMRANLHVDNIQGEALWRKFLAEIEELTSYLRENDGKLLRKEDEENMPLPLNDYEWKMLNAIWSQRYNRQEITDWKWIAKIRSKQLTAGELAFLNAVVAAKQDRLSIEAEEEGMNPGK